MERSDRSSLRLSRLPVWTWSLFWWIRPLVSTFRLVGEQSGYETGSEIHSPI